MEILRYDELPGANNSLEFEGADHGGAGVSVFLVDAAPGRGPSLHKHDYAEVFIVLEGHATFRGPDGDVEVVPAMWWSSRRVSPMGSGRRGMARDR